jgi:hypothetical protein
MGTRMSVPCEGTPYRCGTASDGLLGTWLPLPFVLSLDWTGLDWILT